MATDITLSKGVRSNLLSLQSTAELLGRTQERLSTGKKVNSALDNPISFFTSSGLSSRANDLSRLLDSVGNGVQTINAADKGITAIKKLIESAQATARQALTAAESVTTYALGQTGNVAVTADTAAVTGSTTAANYSADVAQVRTSSAFSNVNDVTAAGELVAGDTITINFGNGNSFTTLAVAANDSIADVAALINNASDAAGFGDWVTASVESGGGADQLVLTANDSAKTFTMAVNGTGSVTNSQTTAAVNLLTQTPALSGSTLTVTVGNNATTTITFGNDEDQVGSIAELVAALQTNDPAGSTTTVASDGSIQVTANNNSDSIVIGGTSTSLATFGLAQGTTGPTNSQIAGFTGQMTIQVGSGAAQTIEFGNGANGEVTTRAGLVSRLASITSSLDDVTVSVNNNNFINIASTNSANITIGGTAAASFGLSAGTYTPTATVTDNATRASLQADYNNLISQITTLAKDASYNGVNLLDGDDLSVIFNEDGSSSLSIAGVDFSATGLGLTNVSGAGFQSNTNINSSLAQLDTATATLRTQASRFGSNLSIVQTRQDFTKNLISVLQTGADNLVLADTNEEGANMLALQTRQQLSSVALSMASQADQSVLRLF
jgi:flagellin-like hook-associated protein FlgL